MGMSVKPKTLEEGINHKIIELDNKIYYNLNEPNVGKGSGYGILESLIVDDNLEEIMVIGAHFPIYVVHKDYGMMTTNMKFDDEEEIIRIIKKIAEEVGRKVDAYTPLLDARLPGGSRVNATLRPASLDGPSITIRKFMGGVFSIVDLINLGTITREAAAFLWFVVEGLNMKPGNILVAGGTASGKTTTLNCLGIFIPEDDRIVTIEDTAELQLPMRHKVRMEARPPDADGKGELTFNQLLINTLRMRPDRIILGEVRGPEAETLFVAMNTGHDGCMGTLHASSAKETITRLSTPPMNVQVGMIPALDLVILQSKLHIKGKLERRITEISEIGGIEKDTVQLNKIYVYDPKADTLKPTGTPSKIKQEIAKATGFSGETIVREIDRRKLLLDFLLNKGIKEFDEVYGWVQEYHIHPEKVMETIEDVYKGKKKVPKVEDGKLVSND